MFLEITTFSSIEKVTIPEGRFISLKNEIKKKILSLWMVILLKYISKFPISSTIVKIHIIIVSLTTDDKKQLEASMKQSKWLKWSIEVLSINNYFSFYDLIHLKNITLTPSLEAEIPYDFLNSKTRDVFEKSKNCSLKCLLRRVHYSNLQKKPEYQISPKYG